MEKIWGPLYGFYFAAYAAPIGDGERFCSYVKVCWTRPDNYWDADCAFKIFGGEFHQSLVGALGAVARKARYEVTHLHPHAQSLVQQRQRDNVPIPRLFVTSLFRHRVA
jgi:hypothetical protein